MNISDPKGARTTMTDLVFEMLLLSIKFHNVENGQPSGVCYASLLCKLLLESF